MSIVKITGQLYDTCKLCACTSYYRPQVAISQLAEELASLKCELKEVCDSKTEITESLQARNNSNSNKQLKLPMNDWQRIQ
jgi:hypothetical protein